MSDFELAILFIGEIKTNLGEEYGLTKYTIEKEFGDFFQKIQNNFRKYTHKTPDHHARDLYHKLQNKQIW